jgi:hypothetical protein
MSGTYPTRTFRETFPGLLSPINVPHPCYEELRVGVNEGRFKDVVVQVVGRGLGEVFTVNPEASINVLVAANLALGDSGCTVYTIDSVNYR